MSVFNLVSNYQPTGDQPTAIAQLVDGLERGEREQTLLGVTGSGKTFTMANIIARANVPTLVLAHNKTLAAQLFSEFKEFFPDNEVHYFVSYFDYYQPEAYIASSDTYIEKDSKINDEIDRLRHAATSALLTRRDVIIVASVSCIYGIGSPETYADMAIQLTVGERRVQDKFIRLLTDIQYKRNDVDFVRGTFRVRGDVVDIFPAGQDTVVRVEFFGDEVERLTRIDPLTGEILEQPASLTIFPSSHLHHAVGQCYRCQTVIEPRVSPQWFVKMKPLAEKALEVVRNGEIKILPKRMEKIYYNWLENIRDWCISRQIWWGHRIPPAGTARPRRPRSRHRSP